VPAALSLDTIVKRTGDVVFAQLDDELLAIDAPKGFLYSLNESGGRVWNALAAPATVREVCVRLSAVYTIDEDTCEAAVVALLEQMREAGLVEIVSA
jgi:hypothetical protein